MINQVKRETKVVTGKIRMSYVNIFTARPMMDGQDPKYSLCILIPKTDKETIKNINIAIEAAKKMGLSIWGGKLPETLKNPLRDGDLERGDQEEYVGHYFVNATSKIKPGIVDKSLNRITDEAEVYSGCYGRVSINFYAFNSGGSQGIGCGLHNVQKLAEGLGLSGRSNACDDFTVVNNEDDILG